MGAKKETRAGKFGRNYAILFSWALTKPEPVSRRYMKTFLEEMQTYSLEPRKEGMPPGPGCVDELEGVNTINPENPRHAAKVIKQGLHLMYQKNTSKNSLYSFLENL
ncbi:MAG: hypothetical protein AABX17_03775 [Nanoarchaeota archaeon]